MDEWYYAQGHERAGPVTIEQMRELIATGVLTRDCLVWKAGFASWVRAEEVPELFKPVPPPLIQIEESPVGALEKKCPRCGAFSLPSASQCPCGHDFTEPLSHPVSDVSTARHCQFCRAPLSETALYCAACGRPSLSVDAPGKIKYAGFWLRFFAYIIDHMVLLVAIFLISFAAGMVIEMSALRQRISEFEGEGVISIFAFLVALPGQWLYFALLESSEWRATLGKRALGIMVIDTEGARISFGRATGRYFAKILSTSLLGIGYLMVAFTEKKQALHDLIANCLVVKRP